MFTLSIVTAEKLVYEVEVSQVIIPAVGGEMGILQNHRPIVVKLTAGGIKVTLKDGMEEILFTNGGYLQFNENKAVILSDIIENVDSYTAEQASQARKRAEEMVKEAKDEIEREKLAEALRASMIRERLAVAQFQKKGKRQM